MAAQFTTLARVKTWLNITAGTDDAFLTALIEAVTAEIISFASRPILTGSFSENYNGNGQTRMPLRAFPVTAVASVTIDGQSVPVSSGPTVPGFTFDEFGVYLRGGYQFGAGPQNVTIAYTAGYATTPLDLDNATAQQVAYEYRSRERLGELGKTLGPSQTVSYLVAPFLPRVEMIAKEYQRKGMS